MVDRFETWYDIRVIYTHLQISSKLTYKYLAKFRNIYGMSVLIDNDVRHTHIF